MRKIIIILWACVFVFEAFAQSQVNDALYIYRNDGKFNAFFYSEIDSITMSKFDELGNVYDEYKNQVIWTQDSVYWIPLEAIDSVSLCKPQNKYSSKVRKIDNLLPYLTGVNGMILSLSSSTPSDLIPRNGEVLIYESQQDDRFPFGFAGRVNNVENLMVVCDSVSFEDVYEEFTCYGKYMAIDEPDGKGYSRKRLIPKKIGATISHALDINGTLRSDTTVTGDTKGFYVTLNGRLALDIYLLYSYSKGRHPYMEVSFHPHANVSAEIGLMGKWHTDPETYVKLFEIPIPIPDTPFFVEVVGGPSLKASAEASVNLNAEGELGFECGLKYENGKLIANGHNTSKFAKPTLTGSINGSLFGGIRVGIALITIGKILSVSADDEVGVEVEANFTTDVYNTPYSSIYEELQKVKVDCNLLSSIEASASLKFRKIAEVKIKRQFGYIKSNLMSRKIVPAFTAPSIEKKGSTKVITSVIPEERLLWPIPIGVGICNQDGNFLDTKFCDDSYMLPESWPLEKYMATFVNLAPGNIYEVYPMIKFMGKEIKAAPSTTFISEFPAPAKIKKFEVNNASFIRDGFEYKNKTCYYDYAATTTVELESAEGVDDWGYVYKDPNGEKIHISVTDLGTKADSRYNYYRTIPKSTATLYGYAKYANNQYAYDTPKEYDLIYEHKPTAFVDVISGTVTVTSAQFEYGFTDIPRTAKCYIATQAENKANREIHLVDVSDKAKLEVSNLQPATTYTYWAYVEYAGKTYANSDGKKTFKTLAPNASTGDCSNVTQNSATVSCTYGNVPEEAVCGVEYTSDNSSQRQTVDSSNGTQKITLNGLKSGTSYNYRAFVKYDGQMYYGEEKTFTTKHEIPDISGVWKCKEYKNGSVSGEVTFELITGGKVIASGLSGSGGFGKNTTGQWSINDDGHVNIQFSWQGSSGGAWKSYGGKINSFVNPSKIEGTANYTSVNNLGGGGQEDYDFVMTR